MTESLWKTPFRQTLTPIVPDVESQLTLRQCRYQALSPLPIALHDNVSEVRKMLNNARRIQPPFAKVSLTAAGKKSLLRQRHPRDSRAVRTVFQTIVGKDPRSLHAAKLYAADAT